VDSKVYRRVTDNATTDESGTLNDFSDDRGEDPSQEDALYIKICPEEQDPCEKTWNANPPTRVAKLYGCDFYKGTILDVAGIMHRKKILTNRAGPFTHYSLVIQI
jgi:hypothetical protein